MIRAGLVSVTFRKLTPREVVSWAARAGLAGVEWGGDIHVPHGRTETAQQVAAMTRDAGLTVSSYGSYYRLGHEPEQFAQVLETAIALGAPIIRVWPGRVASGKADSAYRAQVAEDGRRVAQMADRSGIRIACEWHGNTLTDTAESARSLFDAVEHAAFGTYWQPHGHMSVQDCLLDMEAALPRLVGLHVAHCDSQTGRRLDLSSGRSIWKSYLAKAKEAGDLFALLEFVRDDDPAQMVEDAAALREWLDEVGD